MADPLQELTDARTPFSRIRRWLEAPPEGVPASVLAAALLRERDSDSTQLLFRGAPKLNRDIVTAVLEALRAEPPSLVSIFLLTALDEAAPERDWPQAVAALNSLFSTLSWGAAPRRATFASLARSRFLPAFQAAAVAIADAPVELLTVLAASGSEASVDALMPHFQHATTQKDLALDRLERLRTHAAKTRPLETMFATVSRLLAERNDASPALAFGRRLGFGEVEVFSVHFGLSSDQMTSGGVPLYQCHVEIDSTGQTWLRVSVSKIDLRSMMPSLDFSNDGADFSDPFKLGITACSPDELPTWFAVLGSKLGVKWNVSIWSSSLRGKKRDALLRWMRGEPSSADLTQPSTRPKRPAARRARSR